MSKFEHCDGKKWAGREIRIEEISESEMKISSGSFVPDSQVAFHTPEAKQTLSEFNSWAEQNPAKTTDIRALRAKFAKKETS